MTEQSERSATSPRRRTDPESRTPSERQRLLTCGSLKRDGARCGLPVRDGGDGAHCWAHDASLQERRRAGQREGGRNSATHRRAAAKLPDDLADLRGKLIETIRAVEEKRLTAGEAGAIGALCRVLLSLYEVGQQSSILRRIEQLERTEAQRAEEHVRRRAFA